MPSQLLVNGVITFELMQCNCAILKYRSLNRHSCWAEEGIFQYRHHHRHWETVAGRGYQHATSKFTFLEMFSTRYCYASICSGRRSASWLVSLAACRNVDKLDPSVVLDVYCPGPHICHTLLIISMSFIVSPIQMLGLL